MNAVTSREYFSGDRDSVTRQLKGTGWLLRNAKHVETISLIANAVLREAREGETAYTGNLKYGDSLGCVVHASVDLPKRSLNVWINFAHLTDALAFINRKAFDRADRILKRREPSGQVVTFASQEHGWYYRADSIKRFTLRTTIGVGDYLTFREYGWNSEHLIPLTGDNYTTLEANILIATGWYKWEGEGQYVLPPLASRL